MLGGGGVPLVRVCVGGECVGGYAHWSAWFACFTDMHNMCMVCIYIRIVYVVKTHQVRSWAGHS